MSWFQSNSSSVVAFAYISNYEVFIREHDLQTKNGKAENQNVKKERQRSIYKSPMKREIINPKQTFLNTHVKVLSCMKMSNNNSTKLTPSVGKGLRLKA